MNSENVGAESRHRGGGGGHGQEVRASCILGHSCLCNSEAGVVSTDFDQSTVMRLGGGGPGGPQLPNKKYFSPLQTSSRTQSCLTTWKMG